MSIMGSSERSLTPLPPCDNTFTSTYRASFSPSASAPAGNAKSRSLATTEPMAAGMPSNLVLSKRGFGRKKDPPQKSHLATVPNGLKFSGSQLTSDYRSSFAPLPPPSRASRQRIDPAAIARFSGCGAPDPSAEYVSCNELAFDQKKHLQNTLGKAIDDELTQTHAMRGGRVSGDSVKYASKRYFIPFGWWANSIPSTASTGWAVLADSEYNPFRLDGTYSQTDRPYTE